MYLLITLTLLLRFALRTVGSNRAIFVGHAIASLISLLVAPWLVQTLEAIGVVTGLWLSQLVMLFASGVAVWRYHHANRPAAANMLSHTHPTEL